MDFPTDFEAHLKQFSDKLSSEKDMLVVSHHDADGITSCAITVDFLRSNGIDVEYKCIKQLDSVTIGEIEEYKDRKIVFTDMGSGQLPLLAEHGVKDFYVIDHLPPAEKYPLQVNPHDFGFDGGREVSGAGVDHPIGERGKRGAEDQLTAGLARLRRADIGAPQLMARPAHVERIEVAVARPDVHHVVGGDERR